MSLRHWARLLAPDNLMLHRVAESLDESSETNDDDEEEIEEEKTYIPSPEKRERQGDSNNYGI